MKKLKQGKQEKEEEEKEEKEEIQYKAVIKVGENNIFMIPKINCIATLGSFFYK